jgi:hypothetical protein
MTPVSVPLPVLSDAWAEEAPARRVAAVAAPAVRRVRRVAVPVVGVVGDCSEPEITLSFVRCPATISALIDARAHTLVAPPWTIGGHRDGPALDTVGAW